MNKTILAAIIFTAAAASSLAQKSKVSYEFPAAMSEAVRAEYIKQCDKGKVLYEINCARCHNTTEKRKTIIPDFTEKQLANYELRVQNPNHESNLPETNVTAEELGMIITFLTYKKKNG